jgi:hypothetical protein
MRSRVAWMKTLRTMRVPAGDIEESGCECSNDCLTTEAGDDIVLESVAVDCLATEA